MKNDMLILMKKYAALAILLVLASLFFTDAYLLPVRNNENNVTKICFSNGGEEVIGNIQKISQISGPSIDGQAASISCREARSAVSCQGLPSAVWVLVLVSYLALLIFNLSYDFKKQSCVRWIWESLMTVIFIGIWYWFDKCKNDIWFPLYVIKLGIVLYLGYLYFFAKKRK